MNTTKKKGWITTFFLAVAILTTTVNINAGTIIGGKSLSATDACTESTGSKKTTDSTLQGTIIGGLTSTIIGGLAGTIIGGLAGTIIGGAADETVDCGTVIGG